MIEYWKNKSLESLFYINENGLVCQEEWKDIPDYIGRYKASDLGRIMSVFGKRKGKSGFFTKMPIKILAQAINKDDRPHLTLFNESGRKNWIVSNLITLAFKNHVTKGYVRITDHKNNIPYDNRLANLQIITTRRNTSKDKQSETGFTGVYKDKFNKFCATLTYKGKSCNLGRYPTAEEASLLREKVVRIIEKGKSINRYIKKNKNKNKYAGVSKRKDKFRSSIMIDKKRYCLGTFDTEKEAGEAYLNFKSRKDER